MSICGRCHKETHGSWVHIVENNPSNGFEYNEIKSTLCDECAAKVRAFILNPFMELNDTNPNLINELRSIG